jgi:hypothetical protein
MISEHIFGFFLLTPAPEAPKMPSNYGGEGSSGIALTKNSKDLKKEKYRR